MSVKTISTWRIFRASDISHDEGRQLWEEVGEITGPQSYYEPDADTIGKSYGEGSYLLIERDDGYSARVREKRIVARRYFEEEKTEADDLEAVAS